MNPNPKMNGFKYAFTGTNCSGKTTMALAITARLKRAAILAEIVSSQDRKVTWKDDYFPFTPIAHYGMITNLIHAEVQAALKGDADVIVTDRSVLDLYAIMCTDHPGHPMTVALEPTILGWMTTYTKVYYLAPLPYQEDGKRPADDFRMATHAMLRRLMAKYALPNVVEIERTEVYKEIAKDMGFHIQAPIFAQATKWQTLADHFRVTVVVKNQNDETTSDVDVWVLLGVGDALSDTWAASDFSTMCNVYFGYDHKFSIMATAPDSLADFKSSSMEYKIYEPAAK